MSRQSVTRLMLQLAVAVAVSGTAALAATPEALWIEGEAYTTQAGSVGPDRPPFGSRAACLCSNWAGRKSDFVVYRFQLQRALADATLHLR